MNPLPNPIDIALTYLKAYENKDLARIEALLAPIVVLRDWKIRVQGKAAALLETQLNFDNAGALTIEVLQLHATASTVAAELRIQVGTEVEIFVVDVFEIDDSGRISALRAYLGRGDEERDNASLSPIPASSP